MTTETRKIFHTCRVLNRNFTMEEWFEYVKTHSNSGAECVVSHNGFDFNINDVCLNPKEAVFVIQREFKFRVKVAQTPDDRWTFGYEYDLFFLQQGGSSPTSFGKTRSFLTEKEATYAGVCTLYDYFEKSRIGQDPKHRETFDKLLHLLERLKDINDPSQLLLFDI